MQAVQTGRILLVTPDVIARDAVELGYSLADELHELLAFLLQTTTPDHYRGGRPPGRSYERAIQNKELWAFSLDCPLIETRVYYKFCLHQGYFYLVSLHRCTSLADTENKK